jgi:ubiquinone/menaquinone biosynthesis C-methylase UbiE
MNEPKLAQKNKVLYKWFRVMRSEGKPIIEPVIIKKSSVILRGNESN